MKQFLLHLLFCAAVSASGYSWSQSKPAPALGPQVVASIKPLALIANDLLAGLASVEVLLPPSADPHHYSLRVSDRRRMQQADLFIWMGPEMERFLVKPLSNLPPEQLLAFSNVLAQADKESSRVQLKDSGPHAWLSIGDVIVVSQILAQRLSTLFPPLQSEIESRLNHYRETLIKLDVDLRHRLSPYEGKAFLADHPAYQALVDAYSLKQVGSFQMHDEISPGARHLDQLTRLVEQEQPACWLVREGQQQNQSLLHWSERWQLPMVAVDVLGVGPEIKTYQALMEAIGNAIETCFRNTAINAY